MSSKLVSSRTLSASFPSPESPQCSEDERGVEHQKGGWYSERVPRPSHQKRYVAAAALMPFSSGRALPSKWDDAERWISSPVNVGNVSTSGNNYGYYNESGVSKSSLSAHFQRTAKSKSGPLGPSGVGVYAGAYNTFSPVLGMGVINGSKCRNSSAIESPASAHAQFEGRLAANGGGLCEGRRSLPGRGDPEWLHLWGSPPSPSDEGKVSDGKEIINTRENNQAYNDDAAIDRAISRRDMATQMYPTSESSSIVSSPRSTISINSPCRKRNQLNVNNIQFSQLEVKDVQVDKHTSRETTRSSPLKTEVKENSSNKITKLQREEARIIAWENLQKAKAESSIQKLEMKLEKKRSSSLEKIIGKLRRAEIKAERMRISLSNENNHVQSRAILKSTSKIPSFCRKFRLSTPRSCTTCYPL